MTMEQFQGSYEGWLVALSVLIAATASYAALDLGGRVTAAAGHRTRWLAGGAIAMGIGIWSMHYIGMLAFHLPVQVLYDVPTVALSLLAAVFASAVALWVVSRREVGPRQTIPGSIVMGLGISAMHYTGMAAMRLPALTSYNPFLVTLSVLIAIVVSFVAMFLAFALRGDEAGRLIGRKASSAVVMGFAIAAMHYTAMAAAHFHAVSQPPDIARAVGIPELGASAIAVTTFMVLLLAIATSVADRKLRAHAVALQTSEEARRGQAQFLRDVIDAHPHMVFAKDREGRFTLANNAVARAYGTTPAELVGKTDADFNGNDKQVQSFLEDDLEVIATRRTKLIPVEPVTDARTREVRWFQTIKVPLVSPDGTTQVLGISTDITEQKRLEERLRQAQKMEAVGQLAGGVAHDFNNLLTAIMGHAELLLEDDALVTRFRPDIEQIRKASQRAAALTQQLLAFSRRQLLQPKVLDLNALVSGMHKLLSRLIGENIELRAVQDARLGPVEADPGQLEQVIMNLAVNARDAMPKGGTLTLTTANAELDTSFGNGVMDVIPGPYVKLAVTDTGVGMNAETQAHLFEPFFTTKEPGKGTGLGLATVYGIVKQSGGYIWVQSEVGRGTTFSVYLPRATSAPTTEGAQAPTPAPPGTETVLVVEDEDAVRGVIETILTRRGYTVIVASGGEEALRLAAQHQGQIHLLVTDVVMPRMSGPEVAEQLVKTSPSTRVLYLTGYTDETVVSHGAFRAGAALLQKPFSPEALARKVRATLGH